MRTLVVSSIQELWPANNPVLFMDESCLKFEARHVWENLDSAITQSLCFDQKTDDADYEVRIQLYKSIFPDVISFLNNYHGVTHSDRYWRIVIDHWTMRTINLIQMRYKKIEKSLASNLVNEVVVSTERAFKPRFLRFARETTVQSCSFTFLKPFSHAKEKLSQSSS